jgi:hypothetical protein
VAGRNGEKIHVQTYLLADFLKEIHTRDMVKFCINLIKDKN